MSSAAKLLEDNVEAWTTLQEHPEVGQLQETIRQRQTELDTVKAEIKILPSMEKMLKVKRSNELQQEIESYRAKETEVENAMQPLISESFELSTAVDTQLNVLKEYHTFMQQKFNETSAEVLQELVEKEQAIDNIMRGLNKQFAIFPDKVRLPEEQQSVPGWATVES